MKKIRLRYAPSPTGYLHIGGARTALFNYLFAKANHGKFIVRIEDTDYNREIKDGEKNQLDGLRWMGIEIDETTDNPGHYGPYKQSERLDIYNKYIDQLLEKGVAYKCYCSPEELASSREKQLKAGIISPKYDEKCWNSRNTKIAIDPKIIPSIRVHLPKNHDFTWVDGVRGEITINSKDVGDWIIKKSNDIPTYNFAVVIDDHLMEISHVMRGEEHISNTPKQLHLFDVFGWKHPEFVHLTIITNDEGKKLSKRDEETLQFIHLFKENGFLPIAIFNFLALLGWSPKTTQEIFNKKELIKKFNLEGLSHAPSMFNYDKLLWTNNYFIKRLNPKELFTFLNPFVKDLELSDEIKRQIFHVFQPQLREGREIKTLIKTFTDEFKATPKLKTEALKSLSLLKDFEEVLKQINQWERSMLKTQIMDLGKKHNVRGKELFFPLRIALTGINHGPDLGSIMEIFGKEKTMKRLKEFINA
ncbi:MAG: glutamate--tRNA ligase [Mycoplasmataceae bacterium]|nr:glutamate--tRNA ligase [Mycoplasmataceae bacterium]